MVSVFSPSAQEAEEPFSISVSPTKISNSAVSSVRVAVTLFVALDVVAVYASVSESNSGVNSKEPIASPDKLVRFLPLHRQWHSQWPVQSR